MKNIIIVFALVLGLSSCNNKEGSYGSFPANGIFTVDCYRIKNVDDILNPEKANDIIIPKDSANNDFMIITINANNRSSVRHPAKLEFFHLVSVFDKSTLIEGEHFSIPEPKVICKINTTRPICPTSTTYIKIFPKKIAEVSGEKIITLKADYPDIPESPIASRIIGEARCTVKFE